MGKDEETQGNGPLAADVLSVLGDRGPNLTEAICKLAYERRESYKPAVPVGTAPQWLHQHGQEAALRAGLAALRHKIDPGQGATVAASLRASQRLSDALAIERAMELKKWAHAVTAAEGETASRRKALAWAIRNLGDEGEEGRMRAALEQCWARWYGPNARRPELLPRVWRMMLAEAL